MIKIMIFAIVSNIQVVNPKLAELAGRGGGGGGGRYGGARKMQSIICRSFYKGPVFTHSPLEFVVVVEEVLFRWRTWWRRARRGEGEVVKMRKGDPTQSVLPLKLLRLNLFMTDD